MIFYHVRLHVIACHYHLWLKEGQGEGTALRINLPSQDCHMHHTRIMGPIHVNTCSCLLPSGKLT